MKKYLAAIAIWTLLASGITMVGTGILMKAKDALFEQRAYQATGAIFVADMRSFDCSGTEIGYTSEGDGIFLTARHCAADPDTDVINPELQVSFSENQGGPFYDAVPIAISLTDDLAVLLVRNAANVPFVKVRPEWSLKFGDQIFNVSFPEGTGKEKFIGTFMRNRFPAMPRQIHQEMASWDYAMPMNLTIAPGSSGSGVFSNKEHALIGVAVGSWRQGSYNIAIPGDRVVNFLDHLSDNSIDKFKAKFPDKEEEDLF